MEALGVAWPLDDLEPQPLARRGAGGHLALVAGIGEHKLQPGKPPADAGADEAEAVPVLDVGRMDDQPQRQAQRVGEQVPLAAIDGNAVDPVGAAEPARPAGPVGTFLPASKPRGPPASLVLTLWLSMMAAEGDPSRPACSRAAISKVAWIVDQMPSCQNRRQ
jgi:hypothetical protein